MNILITGGTGFIGKELCHQLKANNHIIVLSRQPKNKVSTMFGNSIKVIAKLSEIDSSTPLDVIINLAGEPIANAYWTSSKKDRVEQSRFSTTQACVDLIKKLDTPPKLFLSGSAVGYYGDTLDVTITESSEAKQEFTHSLCKKWEDIANEAKEHTRVVTLRTGLVLGHNGGLLSRLWLPFKLGLGGRLGNGKQFMPWIHINDFVSAINFISAHDQINGAINMTAPNPATNTVFTKVLAEEIKRPAFMHLPEKLLKVAFGEMSTLLLGGQKAIPQKLLDAGYEFSFTKLEDALADIHQQKG